MIDFHKTSVFKLKPIDNGDILKSINEFLIDEELVFAAFKTIRDQLVFTNKRIITANVQGITGKKIDYTSIPYSKITTFSIETAGVIYKDCVLELHVAAVIKVRFEINGEFDIVSFNKIISEHVL